MDKKHIAILLLASLIVGSSYIIDDGIQSNTGTVQVDIVEDTQSLQEIVNNRVEDGMVNVHINTDIRMSDSESKAKLMIQNIPTNRYTQQVDIVDSNDDIIYKSANIKPGYKIEMDYIEKELAVGTHKCTAIVNILDSDELGIINSLRIPIEITVEN